MNITKNTVHNHVNPINLLARAPPHTHTHTYYDPNSMNLPSSLPSPPWVDPPHPRPHLSPRLHSAPHPVFLNLTHKTKNQKSKLKLKSQNLTQHLYPLSIYILKSSNTTQIITLVLVNKNTSSLSVSVFLAPLSLQQQQQQKEKKWMEAA